uniref:Ribosomal protein L6 n=1 Tax=Neotessella volvocina TaxID=52559 RepID=A0A3G2QZY1_9STRA|nr:ribosomal protein L6 [Neotessella volvocina]
MSRIGKREIIIPENVSVNIETNKIKVNGKHGLLERELSNLLKINLKDNKILIEINKQTKQANQLHGLSRVLIQNMVTGVDKKFYKILIAEGVGYRFQVEKKLLTLNVGFTNPVKFEIPNDLEVKLESNTKIIINGIDKEKVGLFAAKIRDIRPPEPYKGKGILYDGEKIIRKVGKTGR